MKVEYRCPNCHMVIHELDYKMEVTEYGVFDIDASTYDKEDEDLGVAMYYCPSCSYLLGNNEGEVIASLEKVED